MDMQIVILLLLMVTIPTVATAFEIVRCRTQQEKNQKLLEEILKKLSS